MLEESKFDEVIAIFGRGTLREIRHIVEIDGLDGASCHIITTITRSGDNITGSGMILEFEFFFSEILYPGSIDSSLYHKISNECGG